MMPQRKIDRAPTMSESFAPVVRPLTDDTFVTPVSTVSPALALQAHLERAVLSSFERDAVKPQGNTSGAVVIIVASAALCWAAALGIAMLAFG